MPASMETIWPKLLADGQSALQNKDPGRLQKVVQDLIVYNIIQVEIDVLDIQVDNISPPDVPKIKITA